MDNNDNKDKALTPEQHRMLMTALSESLISRSELLSQLGKSYSGDRDLYEAFGYPQTLTYSHYSARYQRQGVARRLVNAYPDACWRKLPIVEAIGEEKDGVFNTAWSDIVQALKLYNYFKRLDRISGIGQYGVLLLGYDDVQSIADWQYPVETANQLLYVQPYTEDSAKITKLVSDTNSSDYGTPETYNITTSTGYSDVSSSLIVHKSRVIHIAEDTLTNDIYGTPRMKPSYNHLQDLELISGSSPEMFYRGAFPGYALELDPEAQVGAQAKADLTDEMELYLHNFKRYIRTQGINLKSLTPQVSDPSAHAELLFTLISISSGIPKRILMGSERGELASSQDEGNWLDRVDERRETHLTPNLIQPFVDQCIEKGILPQPVEGYHVIWPDLETTSDADRVGVAKVATETLAKYIESGVESILPFEIFLQKFFGMTDEEVASIKSTLEDQDYLEKQDIQDSQDTDDTDDED